MRSEDPMMVSRREFLASAIGVAVAAALSAPIRAAEARSARDQPHINTSKSGPATGNIPLNWDVFVTPGMPVVTSDLPPGETAAVATDFVNTYSWRAGCCPGRHPFYPGAGTRPGELGCGERQESDDDLRHTWSRRSFPWRQYSSGAISGCAFCCAAGCD